MSGITCSCVRDHSIVLTCIFIVQSSVFQIKKYQTTSIRICICQFNSCASIRKGIVIAETIYIFAHTNVFIGKDDPFGRSANFGSFYYESIRSPFLLWKMYLDTVCRIVFNVSEKFLLPILFSIVMGSCRSFTACTTENCPGLKIKIIKALFYKRLVEFCLYLTRTSCQNVNPNFIHVYRTYKRNRDFFSCFLEFDRYE